MEEETKVAGCDFLFSEFMEDRIRRDRQRRKKRRLEQKQEPRQLQKSNVCPYSKMTGYVMAEYRNDNLMWLLDFRDVLNLMMTVKYDIDSPTDEAVPLLPPKDCANCLIQIDFSIPKPTTAPTTGSPTGAPTTRKPSAAPHSHSPTISRKNDGNAPQQGPVSSSSTLYSQPSSSTLLLLVVVVVQQFFVQLQ